MSGRRPAAELLAVRDGRIAWLGSSSDLSRLASQGAEVVDCDGQTIVPGFTDSHCHVLAYAASLLGVDCGPGAVSSIADIKRALRDRAADTECGQWVRGGGYSEFSLREKRHPSRWELDEAVPSHPVRLNHRSGHACVLNTAALALVGITGATPDPANGVIGRDRETGEPTGLLMEMDGYLEGLMTPLSADEFDRGVEMASRRLVSLGVTSVQDATHTNSPERWDAFERLKSTGRLAPRVVMMAGSAHLDGFRRRGLRFGSGDSNLSLGAAKIMLTATTGNLMPDPAALRDAVAGARAAGFQVAIHAVESGAVEAAIEALTTTHSPVGSGPVGVRDRIEHCSECPPEVLEKLADSGLVVVTQPAFLYYSGRRYLAEVAEDVRPWLYRIDSFVKAGVLTAAGSDAPVVPPGPLVGICAAVTRRARTGETVGESERVSRRTALRMYTANGAYASFQDADKGTLEVGKLADLVVLDGDPTSVEPERIRDIEVTMTVIGGEIVWRK